MMDPHPRTRAVGVLSHGDHSSLLYSSVREQMDVTAALVKDALVRNERVICVGEPAYAERASSAFGKTGARAIANGQLLLENSAETYMREGRFDAERMLRHYSASINDAVADGYSGLRVAADMSWAGIVPESGEDLIRYEHTLDSVLEKYPAVVVCQYDRRIFSEAALASLQAAHNSEARPNPLHESMQLSIEREYDPHGLRVAGEIDISNRAAFRSAIAQLAASPEQHIVVDLAGVEYMDAASIAALALAALNAPAGSMHVRLSGALGRVFRTAMPTLPHGLTVEEVL